MLEVAVIADDLTGAAEAGAAFLPAFSDARLVCSDTCGELPTIEMPPVLALHTHSRAVSPEQARLRVELAVKKLAAWRPRRVFKKIDSSLRGNIGAEADAVIDTMGLPISFIAPSYPDVGRITIDDSHLVNGKPAAHAEIARNANERAPEALLSQTVAVQSHHRVDRIDIKTITAGVETLRIVINQLAAKGVRHVVFDSTERRHLAAVAALALNYFPTALLVGSAGLASALSDQMPRAKANLRPLTQPVFGHHLIALGTASARAGCQVEFLQRFRSIEVLTFNPERLAEMEVVPDVAEIAKVAAALQRGDVVVRIATAKARDWSRRAQQVVNGFGALIAAAVGRIHPASLFLSGGDTAFSVLSRLGVRQLKLERVLAPGLIGSTIVGYPFGGLAICTKPGALGDDNALLRWRNAFA